MTNDFFVAAVGRVANRTPIPDADRVDLTKYDAESLMHYCGNSLEPTDLDYLGVEMLYSSPRLGCLQGCLEVAGGVWARSDGRLSTDWARRGGNVQITPCVFSCSSWTDSLDLSEFQLLEFGARARWKMTATNAGGKMEDAGIVTKSNEKHAGLLLTAL